MTGAFLSIDNVAMSFGGLRALDGVSFEVECGPVVGLIGPNGSGKTTLMNVISGVYKPTWKGASSTGRASPTCPLMRSAGWASRERSRS